MASDSEPENERRPLLGTGNAGSGSLHRRPSQQPQPVDPDITVIPIQPDEDELDKTDSPSPSNSKLDETKLEELFPKEFHKTVVAAIFLFVAFFLNTVSLVLTHQRLPNLWPRQPLPDILLDWNLIPEWDGGLNVAEIIIMISVFSVLLLMVLHRFRWIVFRRVFFIMGLLYLMRALTMYVTVVPVASYTYYCSPKFNHTTVAKVLEASFQVLLGMGLSITGEHTYCGDYIYSGHTVILVMVFLIVQEYSPNRSWKWKAIHWIYGIMSFVGICFVLIARGHYTIDVLIGYYVTTRVFWIYHTLASYALLKESAVTNYIGKTWWYIPFQWLEGNVSGRLPHHYSVPFMEKYSFYLDSDSDQIPTESHKKQIQRIKNMNAGVSRGSRSGSPSIRQALDDSEDYTSSQ